MCWKNLGKSNLEKHLASVKASECVTIKEILVVMDCFLPDLGGYGDCRVFVLLRT